MPKKRAKRTVRAENIDNSSFSDSDSSSNITGNDKESIEEIRTIAMKENTNNFQGINNTNDEEGVQSSIAGKKPTPKVKDLNLKASNIGSVFISKISASQAKPFTVPAGGFTQTEDPANEKRESASSESGESEKKSICEDNLFDGSKIHTLLKGAISY